MAGVVLAVGALASSAMLTFGFAAVGAAAVSAQRAAGAADAAALAAADAVAGTVTGVPCERAAEVAGAVGGTLISCAADGLVVTVAVTVPVGALHARAEARAGPPP